ncbi:MAG: hypothetical protein JNK65_07915 [Deltaproteobacteria bacterium]|nr:hypothetical protein [Deltaproteobacteria bacterium]
MEIFSSDEINAWRGNLEFPDGQYVAELIRVGIRNVKDEKRLVLQFKIKSPTNMAGEIYDKFFKISGSKGQIFWTKNTLMGIGVNVNCELPELEEECRKVVGTEVSLILATVGKYQNAEIQKLHTQPSKPSGLIAPNKSYTSGGDDIPF